MGAVFTNVIFFSLPVCLFPRVQPDSQRRMWGYNNPILLDPTKLSPPFSRSLKQARKKRKEKEKRSHGIKINLTQPLILGLSGRGMYVGGKAGGLHKSAYIDTGAGIIDDTGGSQSGSEYSSAGVPPQENVS